MLTPPDRHKQPQNEAVTGSPHAHRQSIADTTTSDRAHRIVDTSIERPDDLLAERILACTYSEVERRGGLIELEIVPWENHWLQFERKIKYTIPWDGTTPSSQAARAFLIAQDWRAHENPYFRAVDWNKVETSQERPDYLYHGPQIALKETKLAFDSPFLAHHLVPHLTQGAAQHGMTLAQYAERIEVDEEFRRQEEEWIKDPYYKSYRLKEGIRAEGSGSGPLGTLAHNEYEMANAEVPLKNIILKKAASGDYHLRIANCGCGFAGAEAYAYAMYIHTLLEDTARELRKSEADAAVWLAQWDIEVKGYSIMPEHLAEAETHDAWDFKEKLGGKSEETTGHSLERFIRCTEHIEAGSEGKHSYTLKKDVGKTVHFEWIDLTDTKQLERLGTDLDLVVLKNTFYIYSGSDGGNWWKAPIKESIDAMVAALAPRGIFITDSNAKSLLTSDNSPSLFFSHPALEELPDRNESRQKFALTTTELDEREREIAELQTALDRYREKASKGELADDEQAARKADYHYHRQYTLQKEVDSSHKRRERHAGFLKEIDDKDGFCPSGVYVKNK